MSPSPTGSPGASRTRPACTTSQRYCDPNIGRFTSPDPSGQEKNPYLYAEGDPVNRIDPSGLASFGLKLEGCHYLCLGGGVTVNDDGSFHPSLSGGAGSPGVSGGVEASGSDANSGATGEVECSAGYYRASASTQSDTGAGASTARLGPPHGPWAARLGSHSHISTTPAASTPAPTRNARA
ncbi:RHS repeat-associated core domain-containing protein [Streptomyces massasporeus]|uniref:RHS repeat-associated core domain-containing protein n=1 Tax=Streptomyces massasporeus TaxID=67324 RepID=UPI00368E46E0